MTRDIVWSNCFALSARMFTAVHQINDVRTHVSTSTLYVLVDSSAHDAPVPFLLAMHFCSVTSMIRMSASCLSLMSSYHCVIDVLQLVIRYFFFSSLLLSTFIYFSTSSTCIISSSPQLSFLYLTLCLKLNTSRRRHRWCLLRSHLP